MWLSPLSRGMFVKESTVWNRCYLQGTVRTSGENGIALEFPTLADACCNIFTLLTWASCLLNPLYPPALHPGVQEQTRRGDETLCREGRELNATACVCAKRTARLSCLLLCVLWLQPAVEIILFIHPSCCAIDCFICLYCLFVSVLFPPYEENVVYYTCKVVARASAWPLVGVYFYDRLRSLILGGFTFCTFICVLSCGLNVSHFRQFFFFLFCMFKRCIICAVFVRVCMGRRQTFYLWLFVSETIYNAAAACLPSILQVSDFFQSAAFPLYLCVCLPACVPVCARGGRQTRREDWVCEERRGTHCLPCLCLDGRYAMPGHRCFNRWAIKCDATESVRPPTISFTLEHQQAFSGVSRLFWLRWHKWGTEFFEMFEQYVNMGLTCEYLSM